jgi:heptosyltransferase-2
MISRILIVRTDRLGDVLLTTPMVRALKAAYPQSRVAFLVRPYTAPLLARNPDVDQVIIDEGGSVAPLVQRLRQERFDVAIVALPRWRIAWATWRAGIPMRIGPASKWYSLLFSHRIWQNRSESRKHEADYNLDLLSPLKVPFQRFPTCFVLVEEEKQWARKELEGHRISFQKPLVILHPGSGGSSSRWPLTHFMELGDRFQEAGCDVVVTGGPGEDYQYRMVDNMRRTPVFVAAGSISVRQLAAILAHTNLLVSNSTGPLHLAVALGVPTVSIYSPVPACHPRRWGPYPAYVEGHKEHAVLIAPDLGLDPADMTQVTVEQVWEVCRGKLNLLRGAPVAGAAVN